jgi:hypothetical protein
VPVAQPLPELDVGATVFGQASGLGHAQMVHAEARLQTRGGI